MGNSWRECDNKDCNTVFCLSGSGYACDNDDCARIYCDSCGDYMFSSDIEDGRCTYCTSIPEQRLFTIEERYNYVLNKVGLIEEDLINEMKETMNP